MGGEDAIIVAIVFGSVVAIVFLGVVGSIINSWVKKGSGKNIAENKEFLAALREFKEKTDRRLSNLEAIIADDEPAKTGSGSKSVKKGSELKEQKSAIQIEIDNEADSSNEDSVKSSKLKNMLNQ